MRRMRGMLLALVSIATLSLGGCSLLGGAPHPPSGAQEAQTVDARATSDAAHTALLQRVAGREPLAVSVADTCRRGQDNWKIHDGYDWSCTLGTAWAVADDTADAGVLIAAWKARLVEVGCEPDEADFDMMESYWQMYGVPGEFPDGAPYTVDDLPGASAWCGDGYVGIGFSTPASLDTGGIGTYTDGELVTDEPYDAVVVRASSAPHVVILATSTNYHSVPGYEEPEVEDLPCACYSGSECDCPGG